MQRSQRALPESATPHTSSAAVARLTPPDAGWLRTVRRWFGSKPAGAVAFDDFVDPLLEFPSEAADVAEPIRYPNARARSTRVTSRVRWKAAIALSIGTALVVVAALGVVIARRGAVLRAAAEEPRPARLAIDTRPSNLEILIDGERRGITPLTLSVSPGDHNLTIRNGSQERVVPLSLVAGADVTQYFELQPAEPPAVSGKLAVATDPPGARVFVDGQLRGTSPITMDGLRPAEHRVSVATANGSAERTVSVAAGGTASVVFSLHKTAGPVGGWLVIDAPFDVEIVEGEDVIGASGAQRIMVAAGRHEIVLSNQAIGYREMRTVDVTAGKITTIRIDPPKVRVSVNARPWADVTLDGVAVGQTPIANMLVTVGSHEVVFRHPQLGERRQTVAVTAAGPNRIVADLTK